jgi:hypothetical protein
VINGNFTTSNSSIWHSNNWPSTETDLSGIVTAGVSGWPLDSSCTVVTLVSVELVTAGASGAVDASGYAAGLASGAVDASDCATGLACSAVDASGFSLFLFLFSITCCSYSSGW